MIENLTRQPWTPEADALLREVWAAPEALKTVLDRFPGRTEKALMTRGHELELPDRRIAMAAARAEQSTGARLKAAIALTPRTVDQMAAVAGTSTTTARRFVNRHRAEMHIKKFDVAPDDGYAAAMWIWGAGVDAKRRGAQSQPQISARYYRKLKRERPEVIDKIKAKNRIRYAEKVGKLVRRDPMTSALYGDAA
ncbi:hypothetical protein SAMN05443245_3413 [Paraburkholderia fungorum]|uniref:Uncharacterized protein n=1 Tax=Paraburkholderia fungorum TaxID=134537 RepID=A0A1H1H0Y0_9BURK|nr:hypothetical protein [Paraburkholderia fungorum]SDR18736.1 hypothetical protein SAMN05443245_3413 [Paraburkholderia fungorum]